MTNTDNIPVVLNGQPLRTIDFDGSIIDATGRHNWDVYRLNTTDEQWSAVLAACVHVWRQVESSFWENRPAGRHRLPTPSPVYLNGVQVGRK